MAIIFRHGQRDLVTVGVALATVIERGDMVEKPSSDEDVTPASSHTFGATLEATQVTFANTFMGIAYEASTSAQSSDISVDWSAVAVYEATAVSAVYNPGDRIAPADADSPATALDDQRVVGTDDNTGAIGRCVQEKATAATLVKVVFASAFNPAANNLNSVVG